MRKRVITANENSRYYCLNIPFPYTAADAPRLYSVYIFQVTNFLHKIKYNFFFFIFLFFNIQNKYVFATMILNNKQMV